MSASITKKWILCTRTGDLHVLFSSIWKFWLLGQQGWVTRCFKCRWSNIFRVDSSDGKSRTKRPWKGIKAYPDEPRCFPTKSERYGNETWESDGDMTPHLSLNILQGGGGVRFNNVSYVQNAGNYMHPALLHADSKLTIVLVCSFVQQNPIFQHIECTFKWQ